MTEARRPQSADRRARQVSRRSLDHARRAGASRRTVIIALLSNVLVGVVKLVAGLISGSAVLFSEAAHSLADTINQGFLLVSLRLSAREPTEDQPFGHGHQRFLWTFMAAVGMFLAGAVFAIGYGTFQIVSGSDQAGGFTVAWIALAIAALAEGSSWARALRQTRGEARAAEKSVVRYVRESRDPTVKLVLSEDTAALIGIVLAALGIGLSELTGAAFFDPAASVAVGLLLVGVAAWMGRDTGHLLVGAAALPEERAAMEHVLERHPDVVEVLELLTMALGPNALLVAARVDLDDRIDAGRVEQTTTQLDRELRDAIPDVTEVFLDATPGGSAASD